MTLGETGVLDFVAFSAVTALVCFAYAVTSNVYNAVWFRVAVDAAKAGRLRRIPKKGREEAYGWLMSVVWMVFKWSLVVGYFFYVRRGVTDVGATSVDQPVWLSVNILTLIYLGVGYAYLRALASTSNMSVLKSSKGTVLLVAATVKLAIGLALVVLLILETVDRVDQGYYALVLVLYGVNVAILAASYIYTLATGLFRYVSVVNHANQHILNHGYTRQSGGASLEYTTDAVALSHQGRHGRYTLLVDRAAEMPFLSRGVRY